MYGIRRRGRTRLATMPREGQAVAGLGLAAARPADAVAQIEQVRGLQAQLIEPLTGRAVAILLGKVTARPLCQPC